MSLMRPGWPPRVVRRETWYSGNVGSQPRRDRSAASESSGLPASAWRSFAQVRTRSRSGTPRISTSETMYCELMLVSRPCSRMRATTNMTRAPPSDSCDVRMAAT